jgi:UDP-glucose 6-dehydrogenase
MTRIGIIGLGYVGLTSAVGLAQLGHEVLGYDLDASRVKLLLEAKPPIHEDGLEQALGQLIKASNLSFTNQPQELQSFEPEFVFVCVGTPQDESGAADLSILNSAVQQVSPLLPACVARHRSPHGIVDRKPTTQIFTKTRMTSWKTMTTNAAQVTQARRAC